MTVIAAASTSANSFCPYVAGSLTKLRTRLIAVGSPTPSASSPGPTRHGSTSWRSASTHWREQRQVAQHLNQLVKGGEHAIQVELQYGALQNELACVMAMSSFFRRLRGGEDEGDEEEQSAIGH